MENSVLIFVVEDDDMVRELLLEVLQDGGFAIATAATGEEAIQMLDTVGADYRALITDVNLTPGKLTGWDVGKRDAVPAIASDLSSARSHLKCLRPIGAC